MQLKAILFDLWETLIRDTPERSLPRRTWRSGRVGEVLSEHGFEIDTEAIQTALDKSALALTALHESGCDLHSEGRAQLFVDELETATGRRAPSASLPALEEVITCMPLEMAPQPAPFAAETIAAVKALGLSTALVCNAGFTTAPHLRAMLEHYGFLSHLDVLVFSDELQVAKPDARIFASALGALGLEACDSAFIGDNPHTDISGAQASGLFAVQIGSKTRDGITPHLRIDSLDQLIPGLKGLARLATI